MEREREREEMGTREREEKGARRRGCIVPKMSMLEVHLGPRIGPNTSDGISVARRNRRFCVTSNSSPCGVSLLNLRAHSSACTYTQHTRMQSHIHSTHTHTQTPCNDHTHTEHARISLLNPFKMISVLNTI